MVELYRSVYQSIEFFPEHSILRRVLHPHSNDMSSPGFHREWLEYARTIREQHPRNILVNARDFDFLILKDMQRWINENVISVYNEVGLKKWAVVIPPQFLHQVSIEQTIEANPHNNFEVRYFETEEEAMYWLQGNHHSTRNAHY